MFQETFQIVLRMFQDSFKEDWIMFQEKRSKDVLRKFKFGLRKFQRVFQSVSRVFKECFNEVLFCDFVVAWISLQLTGQKEGLFFSGFPTLKK